MDANTQPSPIESVGHPPLRRSVALCAAWVAVWTSIVFLVYIASQLLWHRHQDPMLTMMTGPVEATVLAVVVWMLLLIGAAAVGAIVGAGLTWLARRAAPLGGGWTVAVLLTVALTVAAAASADWPSLVFGLGRPSIHMRVLGCLGPGVVGCAVVVLLVRLRACRAG